MRVEKKKNFTSTTRIPSDKKKTKGYKVKVLGTIGAAELRSKVNSKSL